MDLVTNGMEFIISISAVASVPPRRPGASPESGEERKREREEDSRRRRQKEEWKSSRFSVLVYISLTGTLPPSAPLATRFRGLATCTRETSPTIRL